MWVYPVLIILSMLWQDTIADEYSMQVKSTVPVEEGLCVTIHCTFIADNRNRFTNSIGIWRKVSNSKIVASNDKLKEGKQNFRMTGNPDNGECTLTITDVRKEDNGFYFFRFEESPLSVIKYNYRSIYVSVTDLTQKPEISIPEKIISGQEVTLTCDFPMDCPGTIPVFQWSKSDQDGIWKNSSTVTFAPSQSDHKIDITCKVILPTVISSPHITIVLDVYYPPSITITGEINGNKIIEKEAVIVLEGDSLRLICSADSNPAAHVTWMKEGENVTSNVIGQGLELSLTNITANDTDTYYCVAWNEIWRKTKKITISLQYPPSIIITGEINGNKNMEMETLIVLEGDSLRLICSADSNPAVNVTWMKGGENVTSNVIGQELELSLTNITANDTDTYYCVAWNEYWRMNKNITITLQYPPRKPDVRISSSKGRTVEASLSVTINEGESLTLNCTADSNPAATARWIKGEVHVDLNNMVGRRLLGPLINITASEADTYRCFAWNRHGVIENRIKFTSNQGTKPETTGTSSRAAEYTIRDIMIGVVCGIGVVVIVLLISKLIARKKVSNKTTYEPPEEPPPTEEPNDDTNQVYMNIEEFEKRPVQIKDSNIQMDSNSLIADQEELHYSTIDFTDAPSGVSSSQPHIEYAEIKVNGLCEGSMAHDPSQPP